MTDPSNRAEARVRPTDGIGVELRFEWDSDLRVSQVFKTREELEVAANEKRHELEARGGASARHSLTTKRSGITLGHFPS
ncbi:MAG TPA: hypothetical protein VJ260_12210 [Vicinamibacterales bacterium]|jgi:hypothetical protein|nr:hypothetical protein [Vicinamibacterales bacterium]